MGEGTVARMLDGGRRCMVRFDRWPATPFTVGVGALASLGTVGAARPRPQSEAANPAESRGDRQSVEALRLGVVPPKGIHRLTVGRQHEVGRVRELLTQRYGMLVISGGYGSGKTHLVELTEMEALSRGYLVGRATFDPIEVPPSHPLRLYAALMRDLRYPDGAGRGLLPLLEKLGPSEEHLHGAKAHRWLSAALYAIHYTEPEVAERVMDFVEGQSRDDARRLADLLRRCGHRGPRMLALPDYRTFGQIMAHLLGGVAAWADDAGYAGLAVLLDEAEYLDQLGATSREMAENVLRFLAMGALPPELLAFEVNGVRRGGQAIHRSIEPRYRDDQPLVVMCAFTPNPEVDAVLRRTLLDHEARLALHPVPERLLPLLAERVYGLVREAYPDLDPEPAHRALLERALARAFQDGTVQSTRQAARMVVEFWDLYRIEPARALCALRP